MPGYAGTWMVFRCLGSDRRVRVRDQRTVARCKLADAPREAFGTVPRAMGSPRRGEGASERRGPLCPKGIPNTQGSGSILRYPVSATAAEKPLSCKGQESFPSWTSPVRPRSPALRKGRESSGLFLLGRCKDAVAAAIFQSRKRSEDADLSIWKYEIRESTRLKVATAFATGRPSKEELRCRLTTSSTRR